MYLPASINISICIFIHFMGVYMVHTNIRRGVLVNPMENPWDEMRVWVSESTGL